MRADDANLLKPYSETRNEAVAFAEVSLKHSGREFTFAERNFDGFTNYRIIGIKAAAETTHVAGVTAHAFDGDWLRDNFVVILWRALSAEKVGDFVNIVI